MRESNGWITDSWPADLQDQYEAAHPEERQRRRAPEPEVYREKGVSDTQRHLAAFFDSVRNGKPPVEDVWAGHRAAACAHLINWSAEKGQVAKWDAKADRQAS